MKESRVRGVLTMVNVLRSFGVHSTVSNSQRNRGGKKKEKERKKRMRNPQSADRWLLSINQVREKAVTRQGSNRTLNHPKE